MSTELVVKVSDQVYNRAIAVLNERGDADGLVENLLVDYFHLDGGGRLLPVPAVDALSLNELRLQRQLYLSRLDV